MSSRLPSFESVKSFFPNIYNSSKDKVSYAFNAVTISESNYVLKTDNTVKDLIDLLTSTFEVEIVLGLKFLIGFILTGKEVNYFTTRVVDLYSKHNSILIKKLCLHIIDHLALQKKEELILIFNSINKTISTENNALVRWLNIQLINCLKFSAITEECMKLNQILSSDSNPLVRRLALNSIISYIKHKPQGSFDFKKLIQKYMNDPHPMVFSTAFYALTEMGISFYLEFNLLNKFSYICQNLDFIDEFYFERTLFALTNFAITYLVNNNPNNQKYLKIYIDSVYQLAKNTMNTNKLITCLHTLYSLFTQLDEKKQEKIAKILIRLHNCAKTSIEKFLGLELVLKFVIASSIVRDSLSRYFTVFYLQISDKEYINSKKLEIIINLANVHNIKMILEELKRYLHYPNQSIKKMIIKSIYFMTKNTTSIAKICMEKLIEWLKLKDESIISQIIICLRKLILEIKDHTKFVLLYNLKQYSNIASSNAKANIIWMITQYIELIPTVALDFFRRLLENLETECDDVKSQILGFGLRLMSRINKYEEETSKKGKILIKYAFNKLLFDKNYYIRERSRLISFMNDNELFRMDRDFVANLETRLKELGKLEDEKDDPVGPVGPLCELGKASSMSIYSNLKTDDITNKFVFDSETQTIDLDEYNKTVLKENPILENVIQKESNEKRFERVESTKSNVNQNICNFESEYKKESIQEIKEKMKNDLDKFFEDDTDDYEVEIEPEADE